MILLSNFQFRLLNVFVAICFKTICCFILVLTVITNNMPIRREEKLKSVITRKLLPFGFSACSSERERNSSGLLSTAFIAGLPNDPPWTTCCDANSSVNRFARFIASEPQTVWCNPIGIGFDTRVWRCLLTILGGFDVVSPESSPCLICAWRDCYWIFLWKIW